MCVKGTGLKNSGCEVDIDLKGHHRIQSVSEYFLASFQTEVHRLSIDAVRRDRHVCDFSPVQSDDYQPISSH